MNKELETALAEIRKNYGEGAVLVMDNEHIPAIAKTPTGVLPLDIILGGGYPVGRVIEIFGNESSGKTTLALTAIAQQQALGKDCAFIDAEHALDPVYAKNLGVQLDKLVISQPENGEMGLEIAEALIRSGAISLLVVDSVSALVPKAIIDGEMGDQHIGLLARLMSKAMQKLIGIASQTGCTVIFINQLREKVGTYGNPEITTGGRALKFYASVRIDIRKKEAIKKDGNVIGNVVLVKTAKNKTYPPFKEAKFKIMYGTGVDEFDCVIDYAITANLIEKAGAWYTFKGERFQGKDNVTKYLRENTDSYVELKEQVFNLASQGQIALE